jgi:hypothetical protein
MKIFSVMCTDINQQIYCMKGAIKAFNYSFIFRKMCYGREYYSTQMEDSCCEDGAVLLHLWLCEIAYPHRLNCVFTP